MFGHSGNHYKVATLSKSYILKELIKGLILTLLNKSCPLRAGRPNYREALLLIR